MVRFLGVVSFMCCLICNLTVVAQKKVLDFSTPDYWPRIDPKSVVISNDGRFTCFGLNSPKGGSMVIVKAVNIFGEWRYQRALSGIFTPDNHNIVLTFPNDTIGVVEIGTDRVERIGQVSSFKIIDNRGETLLAYQVAGSNELTLLNLTAGLQKSFSKIIDYQFSKNGDFLILNMIKRVIWMRLSDFKMTMVYNDGQASQFTFDNSGTGFAFFSKEKVNETFITRIRYFKEGMDSSKVLVQPSNAGMYGCSISNLGELYFGRNDKHLFFYLDWGNKVKEDKVPEAGVPVNIRNYRQDQLVAPRVHRPLLAATRLDKDTAITWLQNDDGAGYVVFNHADGDNSLALVNPENSKSLNSQTSIVEQYSLRQSIYYVSVKDASRRLIKKGLICSQIYFSTRGKFMFWYDEERQNWFTYNTITTVIKNISANIKTPLALFESTTPNNYEKAVPENIIGWLDNDRFLLLQDRYDTWQIDPDGKRPPVNLTRHFGYKNNVSLRYLDFNKGNDIKLRMGDTLIYAAFDHKNRNNGFFRLVLGKSHLKQLTMGPEMYYYIHRQISSPGAISPFFPLKAGSAGIYLVERMKAGEYPNIYSTTDFQNFNQLTKIAPEASYNWYTTELIHWQVNGQKQGEGILYKPENFDIHKKYPLIFFCYEKNADALNCFIHPALSYGAMSIPFFVSNGYLVFVPDIEYTYGLPGRSAFDYVVTAAKHLTKMPWVDEHHMGLQGHSYGGFEANYIVSHTNLFAAAAPSAGSTDLISEYNSSQHYYERGQGRIGTTLWKRPDLYVENSPIFKADKVCTPMLILHNNNDANVPFSQESEWYTALVRLGKKVWLLSYDGEGHTINNPANQLDYSIRLAQFFNHFLKGDPLPKWMMN